MRCIHGIELMEPCDRCAFETDLDDEFYDEPDEVPGLDDYCYMGHAWCYDMRYAERRADEADWEADRDGLF